MMGGSTRYSTGRAALREEVRNGRKSGSHTRPPRSSVTARMRRSHSAGELLTSPCCSYPSRAMVLRTQSAGRASAFRGRSSRSKRVCRGRDDLVQQVDELVASPASKTPIAVSWSLRRPGRSGRRPRAERTSPRTLAVRLAIEVLGLHDFEHLGRAASSSSRPPRRLCSASRLCGGVRLIRRALRLRRLRGAEESSGPRERRMHSIPARAA